MNLIYTQGIENVVNVATRGLRFTLSQNTPGMLFPDIQPDDEVISEVIEHNPPANERSVARRLALQALYEIDSSGHPVGTVMHALLAEADPPLRATTVNYMRRLVLGVTAHRGQLDGIIQGYAPEWPLSQVAIIDRNILRMAAYEFALLSGTPVSVSIDEAVELAKLFGAEGAPRFVNGVLGALADNVAVLAQLKTSFSETLPPDEL